MSKQPLPVGPNDDPRLKMVKRISKLMDEQFTIGRFKFGLDPVLNFIPVLGDLSGYLISVGLIITMVRHGASGSVAARMILNASLDAFIGTIPVLGWVFDFFYKANTRNVRLLTEHYTSGKHTGSAKPVIFSILIVAGILVAALLFAAFKLLQWFIDWGDAIIGVKI